MNYTNQHERLLSKQDVGEIRGKNLKSVTLHWGKHLMDYYFGEMYLSLNYENDNAYIIPMSGKVDGYVRNEFRPDRAYAYLSAPDYSQKWKTIVNFLRPNDYVTIYWRYDNNNQYEEKNGLHHDEVYLVVRRGKKEFYFLFDYSVCEQNSARMLRMGAMNEFAPMDIEYPSHTF